MADRFREKVRALPNGCIEWTASKSSTGYGTFRFGNDRSGMAHRWAYEQARGPIPEGKTLDHICRNRACVNPDHLEAVEHRENLMRGETVPARNAAKTHCPQGHPYAGTNLYIGPTQGRQCRTCRRERNRATRKAAA